MQTLWTAGLQGASAGLQQAGVPEYAPHVAVVRNVLRQFGSLKTANLRTKTLV